MKRDIGNTIPIVIGIVALLLLASVFLAKRAVAPELQMATTTAATTSAVGADAEDSPLEKLIDKIIGEPEASSTSTPTSPKNSGKVVVDPALCKGRCAPNEECRKKLGCAPCAPNTPPEYGNLCTCEPVYNCVLK